MKMELFILIANYIFRWYVVMCLINILLFWKELKQYHVVYKTLKDRKWFYYRENKTIISSPIFTNEMIVWRYETNSFGLKNGLYLYSSPTHYFNSPYSLYWLWKYKKWFREHIDLTQLQDIY